MAKENKKYNIIIVLCPSEALVSSKNKLYYYELERNKKEKESVVYLGGKIRMQAAVDMASYTNTMVVVGGSKKKVDDMQESQAVITTQDPFLNTKGTTEEKVKTFSEEQLRTIEENSAREFFGDEAYEQALKDR